MQPNVIMILIDDLGWMDLSCQGSSFYETPNIDKLCAEGMAFDQAYAACPVCSPSRASILTGKYPARLKVTDWIDHENYHPCRGKLIDAPYVKELPLSEFSLAKAFQEAGYQTWHVGKWHLGKPPLIRSSMALMSTAAEAGGDIRRKAISVRTTWKISVMVRKGNI